MRIAFSALCAVSLLNRPTHSLIELWIFRQFKKTNIDWSDSQATKQIGKLISGPHAQNMAGSSMVRADFAVAKLSELHPELSHGNFENLIQKPNKIWPDPSPPTTLHRPMAQTSEFQVKSLSAS
jgi:hypothetical protein